MTFRFLLAEGFASMRRLAGASAIGAMLTGIALSIVGGFATIAIAYRTDLHAARSAAGVEVFLAEGTDRPRGEAVAGEISSFPGVRSARLRTREEAFEIFAEGMNGDTSVLPSTLPLPATIQVELYDEARGVTEMEHLSRRLREINDVEDVAFPGELVRLVEQRTEDFLKIALMVGVALSLSVIGVVANTAQLTVVSRRSVIRTMNLLGVERSRVLAPFVIHGGMIGLAGGMFATITMYAAWLLFPGLGSLLHSAGLIFFPLIFPAAGMALGAIGAGLAGGYRLTIGGEDRRQG